MRLLLLAAALLAAPAAAQPATPPAEPPSDPGQITVTGERLDKETIQKQATAFVRGGVAIPEDGQYARWLAGICPKVSGIAEPYAAIVRNRILAAAQDAKAPIGLAKCRPNMFVVFSPDARRLATDLARGRSTVLASARRDEREAFVASDLPIRWVYGTEAGFGDGGARSNEGGNTIPISGGEGGSGRGFGGAPANRRYTSSLITTGVRVGLASAIAVVDLKLAEGVPLTSVADYVALVTLAQLRLPARAVDYPTILDIFTRPGRGSEAWELSRHDRAFLRALYSIPVDRNGRFQRTLITARMTRELTGQP